MTDIRLFPEIRQAEKGCVCEHTDATQTSTPSDGENISKAHCCKNIHYYHKIQVFNSEKQQQERFIPIFNWLSPTGSVIVFGTEPIIDTEVRIPDKQPCVLAGKALVLAIHQFRIPSPSSDC